MSTAPMSTADTALSIRPVFVGWAVVAARLWLQGYIAALCGAVGTILTTLLYHIDIGWPGFIAFGAIGFVVAPFGIYNISKLNYARTEYRFYPDRLEFEEGFFTVKKKTIMFRDVQEVTLQKSVTQRMYGLGTINLATLASEVPNPSPYAKFGFASGSESGASVQDIPNPDEAFAAVQKMVDACRNHVAGQVRAQ